MRIKDVKHLSAEAQAVPSVSQNIYILDLTTITIIYLFITNIASPIIVPPLEQDINCKDMMHMFIITIEMLCAI